MIYVICSGGLGNQMFQYAFYDCLKREMDVEFDCSFFDVHKVHSGYQLDDAFGIHMENANFNHFSLVYRLVYRIMTIFHCNKMFNIQYELDRKHIKKDSIKKNDILFGYWQGAKLCYIDHNRANEIFRFKNISSIARKYGEMLECDNSVIIHVRRGDYLKYTEYLNLSSTNYYKNAISYIKDKHHVNGYFVVSDDIEWCKNSGIFPKETEYISGLKAYEDMYLLSRGKKCILANSTFSWWGGYLGSHNIVIRPSKYKVRWSEEQDSVLFPKEWIKVEVN